MKRLFLVPTALAFHAILLFGFRRGAAVVADPVIHAPADPKPKDAIEIEWPASREPKDTPVASYGKPDASHSELLEPPVNVTPIAITIPVSMPNPRPPDSRLTVINGPWGDPASPTWLGLRGSGPVSPDHLDNPPRTRTQLAPVYPYEARVDGRPGEVLVEFVVDEAGRVLDPHVVRSNDPVFEAPTLRAVAKWRFEPGRKNGQVVRFRMSVPVAFAVNS